MGSNYLTPGKTIPMLTDSTDWEKWIRYIRFQANAARVWQYLDPKISDRDIIKFWQDDTDLDDLTKETGRSYADELEYWVDQDGEEYERALNCLGEILKQIYATIDDSLEWNFKGYDEVCMVEGLHLARRLLVHWGRTFDNLHWTQYTGRTYAKDETEDLCQPAGAIIDDDGIWLSTICG